jgi:hypothetical protein
VPLTAATISEFLATWEGVEQLLAAAKRIGFTRDSETIAEEFTSDIYDMATLAGISNLGGLKKALETADISYLERVWTNHDDIWEVSGDFVVLLMLIYSARKHITTKLLIARNFGPQTANAIVKAFDEKPADKSKQPNVRA